MSVCVARARDYVCGGTGSGNGRMSAYAIRRGTRRGRRRTQFRERACALASDRACVLCESVCVVCSVHLTRRLTTIEWCWCGARFGSFLWPQPQLAQCARARVHDTLLLCDHGMNVCCVLRMNVCICYYCGCVYGFDDGVCSVSGLRSVLGLVAQHSDNFFKCIIIKLYPQLS